MIGPANPYAAEFLRVFEMLFPRASKSIKPCAPHLENGHRLRIALGGLGAPEPIILRAIARANAYHAGEVSPLEDALLRALDAFRAQGAALILAVPHPVPGAGDVARQEPVKALRGSLLRALFEAAEAVDPDTKVGAVFLALDGMHEKGWIDRLVASIPAASPANGATS